MKKEKALTVRQILNKAQTTLYLRQTDYNRSYALTLFVKELEKRAKKEEKTFQITSTHVVKMQCRHLKPKYSTDWPEADPTTEVKTLRYAKFTYGNKQYYMQFSDNPFFPAYINRYSETILQAAYRPDELHEIETGAIDIFKEVEMEVVWHYNGMRNINKLKKHLLEKFDELNEQPEKRFWKSHKKEINQIVYTR